MITRLILSLVLAIAGYFLGIVAEATRDSGLAIYVVSCLTKIGCFLIAVPLAYSAGKKIRRETNITGIPGLRFASWIMYGVALVHFLLFFQWRLVAAGNSRMPDGQIALDAAIFFISAMFMISESWNSYKSKD
jgi:membrane-bound acyltransferase YfiQ involved in biofilm formation